MNICEILSISHNSIGNKITVQADIWKRMEHFSKKVDSIVLELDGNFQTPRENLEKQVLEIYESSLT